MLEVITPELQAYQNDKIHRYQQQNLKADKDGIVFIGDSLIDFFPLKKYLGREANLINRGIAGADTDLLMRHLQTLVLDLEPAQLFILIGTNDIGLGKSITEIYSNIVSLISEIKAELLTCQIHLISLLPVNKSVDFQSVVKIRTNKLIQDLNQDLSVLAGVDFIAVFDDFLDDTGQLSRTFTKDGLHLNPDGYALLADKIKKYL